ncbi:amino acid ABC transporter substrate-binding protein [Paenacidovorax monticola]|uniref:Amino acid ABC transporter substrate-binding protein n=2 Tax=Paenacidovorax monticola TaxID=1926868 RepID=A0A7H0HLL7_9BURK|nr:ABC transporter substrate-binding protein [Paenacidovorax monticola]QNP61433.1 amino acid ABC transporter substrate-binding protein [Paenacidovorax monticola]
MTQRATALLLASLAWGGQGSSAIAAEVLDRIKAQGVLKVCIWPDYYGITYRSPRTHQLNGIDIELSRELSKELSVRLEYVESSFTALIPDLLGEKCDVGMFAIGVLPQRQEKLRFTQPYLHSDIYAITTKSNAVVRQWADIDKPGVLIAVQKGTFMEPVMTERVKQATVVAIKPPQTREKELMAGRVDVFMTDYPYSRRLLDNADWARLIEPDAPFHVLPYAYAVRPGDAEWLAYMDQFVAQIKRDGRLEKAARNYGLGPIVVR